MLQPIQRPRPSADLLACPAEPRAPAGPIGKPVDDLEAAVYAAQLRYAGEICRRNLAALKRWLDSVDRTVPLELDPGLEAPAPEPQP